MELEKDIFQIIKMETGKEIDQHKNGDAQWIIQATFSLNKS